jgi:hypothetical protein
LLRYSFCCQPFPLLPPFPLCINHRLHLRTFAHVGEDFESAGEIALGALGIGHGRFLAAPLPGLAGGARLSLISHIRNAT